MKEKIIVTGATGFIASRLIPALQSLNYDVWAMIRHVTGRTFLRDVKTVWADIRDPLAVRQAIRLVMPDRMIHLAAISPVAYSYDKYVEVTETNFQGTVILAETCLREVPHFKQFIFAGTSEEYGNQENFPINEKARCFPNSPYAVAKNASTKYLQYMMDAYDFPATILRPFNTYGRTKNTHFVTERIITQMLNGNRVRLGDPMPLRDFMHIEDHIQGYLHTIGCEKALGEIINLCTGRSVSILELMNILKDLTEFENEIEWHTIPARPLDIFNLTGDNRKAKSLTNWTPKISLERGLKRTIQALKTKT